MDSLIVIYIDDYAAEEQSALDSLGVLTTRVASANLDPRSLGFADTAALIRGPKLKPSQFDALCSVLSSANIISRTSPYSFLALSNSDSYERSIQANVPEMRTMPMDSQSVANEIAELSGWGTLFVRSELGSAAKLSGIESCLISDFRQDEIKKKIDALKLAHPSALRIIVRKVVDINKVDGKSVEGRFIVLAGQAQYLDHFEVADSRQKQAFEAEHLRSAALVADSLRQDGISGDYFIDIAETKTGGWFVVEIKPLANGTIRNIAAFGSSLLRPAEPG